MFEKMSWPEAVAHIVKMILQFILLIVVLLYIWDCNSGWHLLTDLTG